MPLGRTRDPFAHPEWIFEVKWDGFRSLAYVHKGECRLISRNGNQFKSFPALAETLPAELRARSAILDGEIVCLDRHGKFSLFNMHPKMALHHALLFPAAQI
jgi:bifunctional non-homologous end joining protein LigD